MARRQLDTLGITPSMLAVRLDRRRLIKLHRGVYAVGHARLTRQGEWLAAVLAAGPGAVLSHRSAAALHDLRGERGRRAAIVAALERHLGPVLLRSELEHRFRELLTDRALPRAAHNIHIGRWEVDACWRSQRLVVELDSRRFHDTPAARRQDAAKERALRAAGWHVVRYRWRDVVGASQRTADELRELLHR